MVKVPENIVQYLSLVSQGKVILREDKYFSEYSLAVHEIAVRAELMGLTHVMSLKNVPTVALTSRGEEILETEKT